MKLHRTLIAAATAALFAAPAAAQQVTFMTGPQGGSWIPLGGALKGMWEKAVPGLSITQTPGAGISNVRGVDEGKAQIGLANSSTTVDGIEGRAPYPKKVTKVCQLANLYPQYFQVVALADAKVNSYADLKGKSLVTQPKGNTGELLTELVLKMNGLSYQSLAKVNYNSYNESVGMMKDGHANVFTLGTTAPASAVMDLASARDIRLVPVDDRIMNEMKKMNPGYNKLIIKAGTYPKQDRDVPVIGYSTHLVVACDLPENTVYQMVKTMAANVDSMAAVVKSIEGIKPKDMALDIGVPFHRGAAKFYKEAGAM
ncbi:MAG TPA: TAXI family TRAP transporter solute-binding subunit [Candidatus Limnocylindrales bacterium]|nr:TAXI family TRAP transporter solute-binding subunit [Candidatus Limnocylindrales bacterium]